MNEREISSGDDITDVAEAAYLSAVSVKRQLRAILGQAEKLVDDKILALFRPVYIKVPDDPNMKFVGSLFSQIFL